MAYKDQMIEYPLSTSGGVIGLSASGTGEVARLGFGMNNYVLRGVGFAPTVTLAVVTAPKLSIRKATVGAASATGGQQYTLTMATGANQGAWRHRIDQRVSVTAGEEVVISVITAATQAVKLRGVAYIEPDWEVAGNMTNVTAVTA